MLHDVTQRSGQSRPQYSQYTFPFTAGFTRSVQLSFKYAGTLGRGMISVVHDHEIPVLFSFLRVTTLFVIPDVEVSRRWEVIGFPEIKLSP